MVALSAYATVVTSFVRFFDWDEAVFYAQSGPVLDGAESVARTVGYVASRELGTAWLIAILRIPGFEYPGTRFLWLVFSIVIAVLAFREAGRRGARFSGEIGAVLFVSFWLTLTLLPAFFGSLLGGLFMLLTAALYLRLQHEPSTRVAVLAGLALAGGFYMRSIETVLVVAVLVAHSLWWHRAQLWRQHLRELGVSAATFVVAFAVPWFIHSTVEYGSPLGHLTAWVSRRTGENASAAQQRFPLRLHNGLDEWFALLRRGGTSLDDTWATVLIGAGLLVLVAIVAAAVVTALRPSTSWQVLADAHVGLYILLAAVSFGFFVFVVVIDKSRYAMYGTAFAAAAAGHFIAAWLEKIRQRPRTRLWIAGVAVLVVWIVANAAYAIEIDRVKTAATAGYIDALESIATVADGENCAILFKAIAKPQITVGSPCPVVGRPRHNGDVDAAVAKTLQEGQVPLLIWFNSDGPLPRGNWEEQEQLALGTTRKNATLYRLSP